MLQLRISAPVSWECDGCNCSVYFDSEYPEIPDHGLCWPCASVALDAANERIKELEELGPDWPRFEDVLRLSEAVMHGSQPMRDWWRKALESCECDPSLPRTERCTKSGWARCDAVYAHVRERAVSKQKASSKSITGRPHKGIESGH